MKRSFLLMSGEFRVTMPVAFLRDQWAHTMTPSVLALRGHRVVGRKEHVNETLRGIIHYADCDDKELERQNLELLTNNDVPCWPDPRALLCMLDRHDVLARCVDVGFVAHGVVQSNKLFAALPYPFVVKVGNSHRGIGKYLVKDEGNLSSIEHDGTTVTYEPFFVGTSERVLIVDDHAFGVRIVNNSSWIANSPGAEVCTFEPDAGMIQHARDCAEEFGLDFAGVDYVTSKDGTHHFLEINQYPGLDVDDKVETIVKHALAKKLETIEKDVLF